MSLKPPSPPTLNDNNLDLTVRFSASLPDLLLSISLHSQPRANTSTLKQHIRTHLPPEFSNRHIRLIHAGKALLDDAALVTSLKRTVSRPPSRPPTPAPYSQDEHSPSAKLKGKAPVRYISAPARIYIHCSIGDVVLSPSELAAEASLASTTESTRTQDAAPPAPAAEVEAPPPPAPRGFDRLLTAGFTPAEVSNLRLQFLSIQSHTHTPDTMPSPHTLRNMEDQWLDNSDPSSNLASDPSGGEGGMVGFTADDEAGALDDMIYGVSMGFFWPVGCLVWGVREEGVWSRRRKMAVVIGVLLNLGLGMVRYGG